MKLLICLLLLLSLASCTGIRPAEHKSTDIDLPITNKKIAALLLDSKNTNNSNPVITAIKAINKDPNNPESLYTLGYLHMQSAIQNKNIHEKNLAVNYFNEILTMVPGNQAVLSSLYNIYYDETLHNTTPDAYENAKITFKQLPLSLHATMNPPSLARFAAVMNSQEKRKQTNHQELRELLLDAIQESPQSDNAYIQLARIYTEDHYFSLALATLKLGIENIGNSVDLFNATAATYENRADVNGCNYEHNSDILNATKYYKLAIPLKPDDQSLHYNLARSYFDQNLNQLALNEAMIATELHPDAENLSANAQNFSMLGYSQKSNELLAQALAQGYNISDTGYHEIYMNQGNWQQAAKGFSAYIQVTDKFTVYDLIKSDIISQQANLQPWPMNKKISLKTAWEAALYKYWSAAISDEELKQSAHNSCEKTEYFFYTGYKDMQRGQTTQAKLKFTAAINQNTYRFIERPLARYFLQK